MLKKYDKLRGLTLLLFALFYQVSYAQNVGINENGDPPVASAMLDVVSTTKGFLAPRMTLDQRGQISSPATGLLVYQTDFVTGFYYYTGSAWNYLSTATSSWSTTGNTSTTAGTNFLGTTDAKDLVIKTNGIERARFLSTGNAGIGTTANSSTPLAPLAPLHIFSESPGNLLYLQYNYGGGGNKAAIAFRTYSGTGDPTASIAAIDDGWSSHLAFSTKVPGADANALTERMRILNSGEVGIGTTTVTSGYKVQINGALMVQGNIFPQATNTYDLGSAGTRWRQIYTNNAVISSSDRRLKTNITDLNYGLKEVMALQPVTYNWKETPDSKKIIGLIAQDVLPIIPEVVHGDESKESLSMSHTDIIPVLINAIKEQQKQIEALKKSEEINRNLINELLKKASPH